MNNNLIKIENFKFGRKIWIIGSTCSGKTTLSKMLSRDLNLHRIELDEIVWHKGWERIDSKEFINIVSEKTKNSNWIIDGTYPEVKEYIINKTDTIIWLDLPLYVMFLRLISRMIIHLVFRKKLWNGNSESFTRLFTKESLFYYLLKTYKRNREIGENLLQKFYEVSDVHVLRITSHKEIKLLLEKASNFQK